MTASAGPVLHQLHHEFGDRVAFLTLYVREAHPGDNFPQTDSLEEKLEHARRYRQRDGLSWPVAVDDVAGTLHRQLDARPNAAYFIGADGRVAYRSLWSNDRRALRAGIDALLDEREPGEKETRLVPMLRGVGKVHEILEQSGPQAQRDVLRQAPPMYLMARLARTFRPLPPLGRSLAAMGVMMAAGAAIVGIGRRLRRARR